MVDIAAWASAARPTTRRRQRTQLLALGSRCCDLKEIVHFPEISILLWIYVFYAQNEQKIKQNVFVKRIIFYILA